MKNTSLSQNNKFSYVHFIFEGEGGEIVNGGSIDSKQDFINVVTKETEKFLMELYEDSETPEVELEVTDLPDGATFISTIEGEGNYYLLFPSDHKFYNLFSNYKNENDISEEDYEDFMDYSENILPESIEE